MEHALIDSLTSKEMNKNLLEMLTTWDEDSGLIKRCLDMLRLDNQLNTIHFMSVTHK